MTEPLFLADLHSPEVGEHITLDGDEGRHAAVVRRIEVDEVIMVADGAGAAVRGPVVEVTRSTVTMRVDRLLTSPIPAARYVAVQALAKGDRAELAVEVLTELGVYEIVPWRARRSIVKWVPERGDRFLGRWRSTAREAIKQSRRFRMPVVSMPVTTAELVARIPLTSLTLVLHEAAEAPLASVPLPSVGEIMIIVGPEGGIAPDELDALVAAGAKPVSISDGVLRTSTAGAVALAQLQALAAR